MWQGDPYWSSRSGYHKLLYLTKLDVLSASQTLIHWSEFSNRWTINCPHSYSTYGGDCPEINDYFVFFAQGKYILTPCPISYAEEQLLHFFGQLLGIAIRADVPLPLDLLGSFWKGLVGESLDPEQDLQEADVLTYNYVKKFENVSDQQCMLCVCPC